MRLPTRGGCSARTSRRWRRQLELEGAIAVGHSFGGYAITWAAGHQPGAFGALLLVDPVIMPRERYGQSFEGSSFVARRRNRWASPEEMVERFSGRPPFATWKPAVLRDYARYGLLPSPDAEGYVLACPPDIEAAIYAGSLGGGEIYDAIEGVDIPVRILRAKVREADALADMSGSPTTPDLATFFHEGEDVYAPQYSHFMPMEDPAFVAGHVRELVERVGNKQARRVV